MQKRTLVAFISIALVFSLGIVSLSEEVDWNEPRSLEDRVMGPNYQLPEGWDSLVEGTNQISHFNYGALEYDPATVRNGDVFEELTGVKVQHQVVSFGDMAQKIATTLLGKSPNPDIFQIERNYVRNARAGNLVNLDELWTEDLWAHYPDWVQDDIEVDGHYYAVPQLGQQWGFYYRPGLIEEAGFDGPPETKEELVEVAKAVTTEDTYGYGFAAGDNFAAYESFLSILYMQDGQLLHEGEVDVTTEKATNALQFLVDLVHEYEVAPPAAGQMKEAELGDMFVGGQIAMMSQWDYHYPRATNPEESTIADDVAFTIPPDWSSDIDGKALADFQIMAINKYSNNIPASKLFLDYMRSQQAHSTEFLLEGNNSLVLDVFDSPKAETEVDEGFLKAKKELAGKSVRENFSHMAEVVEALGSQVRAAVTQSKSVEKALSDAQSQIDKAME